MTPRQIVMGLALVGAGGLALFGERGGSGGSDVVEPAPRPAPNSAPSSAPSSTGPAPAQQGPAPQSQVPAAHTRKGAVVVVVPPLIPRDTLWGDGADGRRPALFADAAATAPAPPVAAAPMAAGAADGLPALPFTYIGKKFENARWEVFLAIGDQTYFAREGSVIEQKYVVNSIRPPTLTLTYLPMKQMQTMNIGGEE